MYVVYKGLVVYVQLINYNTYLLELGAGADTGRHFRSALPAGTETERLFSDRYLPDLMPDPVLDLFRSGMGSGMVSGK